MNVAIILAGGTGSRMGKTEKPKQFLDLKGKPVIAYSLETFQKCIKIDAIGIVCAAEYEATIKKIAENCDISKLKYFSQPGQTRSESSWNMINALKESASCGDDDIVLIHDAARPLVTKKIIEENIIFAKKYGAATTVVDVVDTILRKAVDGSDSEVIGETLDRTELCAVQTPQSFKFRLIYDAYKKYFSEPEHTRRALTDDASIFDGTPQKVHLVYGDKKNIKLTTPADFAILSAFIE